jgi:hypothetical protein
MRPTQIGPVCVSIREGDSEFGEESEELRRVGKEGSTSTQEENRADELFNVLLPSLPPTICSLYRVKAQREPTDLAALRLWFTPTQVH